MGVCKSAYAVTASKVTLLVAAALLVASAGTAAGGSMPKSSRAARAAFPDAAFTIDLNKLGGSPSPNGIIRAAEVDNNPVLGLADIAIGFARVTMAPFSHNTAHIHPRGSETLFLTKGTMEVFFVEDNGPAPRVVANTLKAEGVALFPAGLIHGQRCTSTGGCAFMAFFNDADKGVLTVASRVCQAPVQSVAAALGLSEAQAAAICGGLPAVPAPAAPAN